MTSFGAELPGNLREILEVTGRERVDDVDTTGARRFAWESEIESSADALDPNTTCSRTGAGRGSWRVGLVRIKFEAKAEKLGLTGRSGAMQSAPSSRSTGAIAGRGSGKTGTTESSVDATAGPGTRAREDGVRSTGFDARID